MTIRTVVIGASFAREAYLPALANIDDAEVVALASARLGSAQAAADQFGIPQAYDDWRVMLERHELDLVCIATPTLQHAPMTLAALEAGAHVLCEKPMAMHAGEARSMLDAAEAAGKLHIIGHELRFNPNRRRIKALLDAGEAGAIRHVNISSVNPMWGDPASRPAGDWWSLAEQGGGRLGAAGSHTIDLIRWWLGDIAALNGQVATMVPQRIDAGSGETWQATADDQNSFMHEMQNGALVSVFMSSAARHGTGSTLHIFGSEGSISLADADERLLFARAGEDYADLSVSDPNATLPQVNSGIWNVSFVALMQELCAAIREGRPLQAGATFLDGLKCQVAMDAIRRSSAERRWLSLSDDGLSAV